jgi:hypothetical protein
MPIRPENQEKLGRGHRQCAMVSFEMIFAEI